MPTTATATLVASTPLRNAFGQSVMHRTYAVSPPLVGNDYVTVSVVEPSDRICRSSCRVFASDSGGEILDYAELATCEPITGMDDDIAAMSSLGYDARWGKDSQETS